MAFAIMRCKKITTLGSVASALQHCYRERETPNADSSRTPGNDHLAARSSDEALGRLRQLLPPKRRKDAVLAVEYVMTASPEWWRTTTPDQQSEFFQRAKLWLERKYGADQVVTATVHRDELSPHLSAFVVPLTVDGRLSAKEFIGNRQKMQADQSSFHAAVQHLGLERGIEGSRANHQRVQAHYAAITQGEAGHPMPTIAEADLKPRRQRSASLLGRLGLQEVVESPEAVAQRLTLQVWERVVPALEAASTASQAHQRVKELQQTARDLETKLKRFQDVFRGLSREQAKQLLLQAQKMQRLNQRQQRERQQAQQHEQMQAREAEQAQEARERDSDGLEL